MLVIAEQEVYSEYRTLNSRNRLDIYARGNGMNRLHGLLSLCAGLFLVVTVGVAADPIASGELLFSDDFAREEADDSREQIGKGWRSNSASRAQGNKQVDLAEGAMHITRHPVADHGVALFHDVAFQDGAVELRFKLGKGDDLGIDFVDRELKTVHAGHLCIARITLTGITLNDSKTGAMDLKIRERRLAGETSPELQAFLKSKSAKFPLKLEPDTWHALRVVVAGDRMQAYVNGEFVGDFQSPGMAHPTKRMITLAVNKSAWVDDVKIWKLK